jgi:hypothetical protein
VAADKDNKNMLAHEVELWKCFEYALCIPNASLFNKALVESLENEDYVTAFRTKDQQFSAESLFMALLFPVTVVCIKSWRSN